MNSNTRWELVQRFPEYKRISKDSPLVSNVRFVHSTRGHELAPTFGDLLKEQTNGDSENMETETNSVIQQFANPPSFTSEASNPEQEKDLVTEGEAKETDQRVSEGLVDANKDIFTLFELLQMPETEIPFLLKNLIPERSITILTGDSDAGKTSLYQQLCLDIIKGKTESLGLRLKTRHKRALIVNTEDGHIAIQARLRKQLSGKLPLNEDSKRLIILTTGRDLVQRIDAILKENPVDLVAIDAYGDVFNGDTRSDNANREFLNQYVEICKKYNCAILFVHHVGKRTEKFGPNKDNMLGSAAIHGKARSVIMLTKLWPNPYYKSLRIVKNNYVGEDVKAKGMNLKFDPVTLLHEIAVDEFAREEIATQLQQSPTSQRRSKRIIEPLKNEAWRLRDEGKTLEAIGKLVGRDKSTISKWLKEDSPPKNGNET